MVALRISWGSEICLKVAHEIKTPFLQIIYMYIYILNWVYSLHPVTNVFFSYQICHGRMRSHQFFSHKSLVCQIINPHPVMSSDLHGPPAGPRRPGTMIFKCVEFLIQLKNKNSSYLLSHITTALNCKIYLIVLASIVCHVKNMINKYMGENVKKCVFQR